MQLSADGRKRITLVATTTGESLAADMPADERHHIGTYLMQERPSGWETPGAVVSIMGIDNKE